MTASGEALDLRALLAPRSVAVIGASASEARHSGRALANLVRTGFAGSVYPVNPKYDMLYDLPCYPDVDALPETPELIYVLLPAPVAVQAVRAAAIRGVRVAIVCSSGFGEVGEDGGSLQAELVQITEEHGIRVVGPNCIGVVSPSGGFMGAPTFNIIEEQHPGGLSILSHSGGLGATVFNRAQAAGLGVHSMVSLGNEADVTMTTVLGALSSEPDVRTVALVVEELRDPAGFVEAVAACRAAGKRIVALKTGRSDAGSAAVTGHTGALAGSAGAFSALLRENGVLEAGSVDQLVDTCHLLERVPAQLGKRIAVVSPSGGETVYVADQAVTAGLELPVLPDALVARLQEWMPLGKPMNPLDLTGQVIGNVEILTNVLDALGSADDIDVLLVCLASWGRYDADALLSKVLDAARSTRTPVVFSSWDAGAMTERAVELLSGSGLPWFPSPDRALGAIALAATTVVVADRPASTTGVDRPDLAPGLDALGERAALEVFAAAGVPVVDVRRAVDPEEAAREAADWDYQVVLKLDAPDVLHKTELGLVVVDVRPDAASVAEVAGRLVELGEKHEVRHDGVLVARKESGVEMIVGGLDDPQLGRFVLLGAGGVLAETLRDTVLVQAPADAATVRRALTTLRTWPVLAGVRGRRNDVDAFVDLVVRFSAVYASSPWMAEVDLNPVLVRSADVGGAVAVDAVIVLRTDPKEG